MTLLAAMLVVDGCGLWGGGATIRVQVSLGMRVLAAPKTLGDVDHFNLELHRIPATPVHAHTTSGGTDRAFFFNSVPDGSYLLKAEAFDSANASITQGGKQTSSNTVSVSGNTVVYSDGGSALVVALTLLNETISGVTFDMLLNPGAVWNGEPVGMP